MRERRQVPKWLVRGVCVVVLFAAVLTGADAVPSQAVAAGDGGWGPVVDWGLQGKHMVALPSGKVLVWSNGASARVWDPAAGPNGGFTANTPAVFGDLHCAGNAELADGRVVVFGGQNGAPHIGTAVNALFDSSTETWAQGASMAYQRWYPSVTTLADGKVLATSGDDANGKRITTPELYNPTTDTWVKLTGAVRNQGLYPHMYVLPNGKVYEAAPGAATALLDPSGTGSWTPGPTNAWGTNGYSESSVMYEPGKILRAGGGDPAIARTAIVDMNQANPQWQETSPMAFPRRRMNLVIMADGELLAVGGTAESDNEAAAALPAEIWNPATKTWRTVAAMSEARMYHSSAVLLPDGRILSAGGEASGRLHAQIYSPPYLSAGPRPTITSSPATAAFGSSIQVTSPDAADVTSVALIRLNAATHAWDQNQRYETLSFTRSGSTLTAAAPGNGNIAPPGVYQLIIKNTAGVPSVAKMIKIDSASALVPGSVTGVVTDQNSSPISGATVETSGASTTTDATGTYTLANLSGGEHEVVASAPGKAQVSHSVIVTPGGTVTQSFQLSPPGQVAGTITESPSGTPIAGASVTYTGGVATTDASGHYSIPDLPVGPLTLNVTALGHTGQVRDVNIASGTSATADFALVKAPTFITGGLSDRVTGDPIVGAPVSVDSGESAVTDSIGRYRIDVGPGMYDVTASAPGYVTATSHAIVNEGGYTLLDFPMEPVAPPATVLKHITLENASLTDPTTGADKVSGAFTRDTTAPLSGTASAQLAAATSAYLEETVPATDDLFVTALIRPAAVPTGDARILMLQNNGTTVGALQLRASGKLRLRQGSTTIGLESSVLTPGTTYRVGLHQVRGTSGNAVLEAYVAPAGLPLGSPFARTATGTWTDGATRVRIGATSGPAVSASFDDIFVDSGAPGSGSGGTTTTTTSTTSIPTGSSTTSSTTTSTPTGGMTMTYVATADALVKSTSPTKNYGTMATLRLRAGTASQPDEYRSLLHFNVTDTMGTVSSAKLRLFVTDASKVGGSVSATAAGWLETGVTYNNAPGTLGPVLATLGTAPAGWVEYDVTAAVQAGRFDFLLTTTSSDSLITSSREGTQPPQLVISHP
ncbi:carboxypeptidase regulatory-like domain-containing protein [Aquihabitans sp. McL0605]|uniref:carboxypeptidase regulatory-like domain-containing protein n=1 Tax=Aquihabitans sp. McL0605 TaxID=3415671 RepID=UPI003CF9A561